MHSLRNVSDPLGELKNIKVPHKFCPFKKQPACDFSAPYRTLDGSCNNMRIPWWGQAEMPYKRIVEPQYADLISEPRVSIDGSPLPNAREVACSMHSESHDIEPFITNMFMEWGQVINHDMTSLSINSGRKKR